MCFFERGSESAENSVFLRFNLLCSWFWVHFLMCACLRILSTIQHSGWILGYHLQTICFKNGVIKFGYQVTKASSSSKQLLRTNINILFSLSTVPHSEKNKIGNHGNVTSGCASRVKNTNIPALVQELRVLSLLAWYIFWKWTDKNTYG